jgi:hypothetical protein
MSEMVERVAQAIYEKWAANRSVPETWAEVSRLGHSIAREARDEARAAIEAMREPTVEMLVAAQEDWMCVRAAEERGDFIWRAMINTALEQP